MSDPIIRMPAMQHGTRQIGSVRTPARADVQPRTPHPPVSKPQPQPAPSLVQQAPGVSLVELEQRVTAAEKRIHADYAAQFDKLKAEAQARGMAEGANRAEQLMQQQLHKQAEQFAAVVKGVEQAMQRQLPDLEDTLVALTYEAVSKVLGEQLQTAEGIRALAQQLISRENQQLALRVYLHPDDLALLQTLASPEGLTASQRLSWQADETLSRGVCVVDTGHGRLKMGREQALQHLRERLLHVRFEGAE